MLENGESFMNTQARPTTCTDFKYTDMSTLAFIFIELFYLFEMLFLLILSAWGREKAYSAMHVHV